MAGIDRRKHDIDVIERVLGGARDPLGGPDPSTDVVDLGTQPWLAGETTTAVQVTVGGTRSEGEDDRDAPASTGGDDAYESDRRGEHKYPDGRRREPKSHRERDRLRSRLERQD